MNRPLHCGRSLRPALVPEGGIHLAVPRFGKTGERPNQPRWVSLASVKGHIEIDKARCKGCAFCIDFCPRNSIELSEELNLKGYFVAAFRDGEGLEDGKECNGCGTCALMCPEVAIEVVRE
jgi:2-oxoglutarate ferredoxin oxidoreductase subunit delta